MTALLKWLMKSLMLTLQVVGILVVYEFCLLTLLLLSPSSIHTTANALSVLSLSTVFGVLAWKALDRYLPTQKSSLMTSLKSTSTTSLLTRVLIHLVLSPWYIFRMFVSAVALGVLLIAMTLSILTALTMRLLLILLTLLITTQRQSQSSSVLKLLSLKRALIKSGVGFQKTHE